MGRSCEENLSPQTTVGCSGLVQTKPEPITNTDLKLAFVSRATRNSIAQLKSIIKNKKAVAQYYFDTTGDTLVNEAKHIYTTLGCWNDDWAVRKPQPPKARVQVKQKSFDSQSQMGVEEQPFIKGKPIISYFKNVGTRFSCVLGRSIMFMMCLAWPETHFISSVSSFRSWFD